MRLSEPRKIMDITRRVSDALGRRQFENPALANTTGPQRWRSVNQAEHQGSKAYRSKRSNASLFSTLQRGLGSRPAPRIMNTGIIQPSVATSSGKEWLFLQDVGARTETLVQLQPRSWSGERHLGNGHRHLLSALSPAVISNATTGSSCILHRAQQDSDADLNQVAESLAISRWVPMVLLKPS